jgi:hypothetical protein
MTEAEAIALLALDVDDPPDLDEPAEVPTPSRHRPPPGPPLPPRTRAGVRETRRRMRAQDVERVQEVLHELREAGAVAHADSLALLFDAWHARQLASNRNKRKRRELDTFADL